MLEYDNVTARECVSSCRVMGCQCVITPGQWQDSCMASFGVSMFIVYVPAHFCFQIIIRNMCQMSAGAPPRQVLN